MKNLQASYMNAPLDERTGKESFEFRSLLSLSLYSSIPLTPQTDKWSNESRFGC